jgi:Undecaprenyl-phosphate galactose phosphotransferase WbaP
MTANSQRILAQVKIPSLAGVAQVIVLGLSDTAIITLVGVLSVWSKLLLDPSLPVVAYAQMLPFFVIISLLVYAALELYPAVGLSAAEELRRITMGTTIMFVVGMALTFATKAGDDWSRQVMITTWLGSVMFLPLTRAVVRRWCCRKSWWGVPCIVMGSGATGARVIELMQQRPWLGLKPVVVVDDQVHENKIIAGVPVVGPLIEQVHYFSQHGLKVGVLAITDYAQPSFARLIDRCGDHLRHIYVAPAMPGSTDIIASTREFANTLVLEIRQNLLRSEVRFLKRSLDLISVVVGGMVILPMIGFIMLLIKLTSSGPIFYGQTRLGRGGKEFKAWKFRSMVKDADEQLKKYLAEHPELREEWERDHKLKNDPRVTWIGNILRRTSLDELPQLWNILKGEMSLVGPRPIVQEEVEKYGEKFSLYKKVRPGLSGLWQVSGRNDITYAERVALDCYYVRNWSVWLDIVILARTVRVVLLGKGAY